MICLFQAKADRGTGGDWCTAVPGEEVGRLLGFRGRDRGLLEGKEIGEEILEAERHFFLSFLWTDSGYLGGKMCV